MLLQSVVGLVEVCFAYLSCFVLSREKNLLPTSISDDEEKAHELCFCYYDCHNGDSFLMRTNKKLYTEAQRLKCALLLLIDALNHLSVG